MQTIHTREGFPYRDLNKNGRLDPYEDPRLPVEERVEDLLRQMTLEEKAGLLFHTNIPDGLVSFAGGGVIPGEPTRELVCRKLMNHFNIMTGTPARNIAEWYNRLQEIAQETRLGIPVTISCDPCHHFTTNPAVSAFMANSSFSQWPEPPGLAAINDPLLVEEFGDIARQEYIAVGIRVALHPQADLATEPRWPRINGTFGEDAERVSRMTAAYIRGFQGKRIGHQSVSCIVKHFPGGGPQKDGDDPHFPWGREQVYPGNHFDYHLRPFEAAFAAGVSQVMPYFGMPIGLPMEEVGFAFNKDVITGLLREKYGFEGIVCTDWGILTDTEIMGEFIPGRYWGVEHLSLPEKGKKALDAGIDQFGGEACPEVIIELVKSGQVPESRLDISARRLLGEKFRLGLFDQPFVDPDAAERIVGNGRFRAAAELAQRKSFVLLKNTSREKGPTLPLSGRPRLYVENIAPEVASAYGELVGTPAEADYAILRLQTPYQPPKGGPYAFSVFFHGGDLDFKGEELTHILDVSNQVPTVVDIFLERPAVLPEIAEHSAALLANFGAKDAALMDVVFGKVAPQGTLPFELPSSMEAVRNQKEDVPYDSQNPLFPFGYGLNYE